MSEEQPTIAEPHDPSGLGAPAAETPQAGTSSTESSGGPAAGAPGPSYGPPPPYAAPPQYPPARPPLRRSRTDRVISGVCGGIAASLGIDAVLIRILMVVGTVFTGGALLIAYVIAWILMPDEPAYVYPAYAAPAPQYATSGAPASFASGGTGTYVDPATGAVYGAPARVVPQPRTEPRSYLGLVVLSTAILVGGVFGILGAAGVSVSGVVVAATMLAIVGVGLLVGTWRGRARWLIAPAIVLLLATQIASAADHVALGSKGAGDRTWTPTTSSTSYELGAGSATLDLAQLPAGTADVTVHLSVGELVVLVPRSTEVRIGGQIGAGEIRLPGAEPNGGINFPVSATVPSIGAAPATTTVDLTTNIGLGSVEVRYATS